MAHIIPGGKLMRRFFSKAHLKSKLPIGLCVLGIIAVVLWAMSIGPVQAQQNSSQAIKLVTKAAQAGYVTHNAGSVSNNNNSVAGWTSSSSTASAPTSTSYNLQGTAPPPAQNGSSAHSPVPVPPPPKLEPIAPPVDIPLPIKPVPCKLPTPYNLSPDSCQIFCPDGAVTSSCGGCGGRGVVTPDIICPDSRYN